jgi:hypothetical protein
MVSLKVAPTLVLTGTLTAPLALRVLMTVGAVVSGVADVRKLHVNWVASAKPVLSWAAVVMVAVQLVLPGRLGVLGKVSVAVLLAAV